MIHHTPKPQRAKPDESQSERNAKPNAAPPVLKRFQTPKADFRTTTDEERKFYQSRAWRNFRQHHKDIQLAKDLRRASALVEQNPQLGGDFTRWLISKAPLCEASFKAGVIEPATVLDHIRPIRQGGAVFQSENLQWLCEREHNRKSGRK